MRNDTRLPRALALALLFVASAALAQKWAKEPRDVLGIRLGETLADSGIFPCGTGQKKPDQPCYDDDTVPGADTRRRLWSVPNIGADFDFALLILQDGKISALTLVLDRRNFEDIARVLLERYGPPTKVVTDEVGNALGARLPSRRLLWEGKTLTLLAVERMGQINQSVVTWTHLPASSGASKERQKKAAEGASKL